MYVYIVVIYIIYVIGYLYFEIWRFKTTTKRSTIGLYRKVKRSLRTKPMLLDASVVYMNESICVWCCCLSLYGRERRGFEWLGS